MPTTKSAAKKSSKKKSTTPPSRRWSAKVNTDSTKPSAGLFKKSAKAIAAELASKKDSPKGPGQGMQMLSFYENRAGKNLSAERKRTLDHAKELLHDKVEEQHSKKSSKKKAS
jgi:tRNA(adenine34) deaminase